MWQWVSSMAEKAYPEGSKKPAGASHSSSNQLDEDSPSVSHVKVSDATNKFLGKLYSKLRPELCAYIQKTFGSGPPEPEDVVQSTFSRFAELENPENIDHPRALLYTMARNLVLDQKRRQQTAHRFIEDMMQERGEKLEQIGPERVLLARRGLQEQTEAINSLPLKQRQILVLSRQYGYTYAEIAEQTGWSLADISRQLHKALATLGRRLNHTILD